MAGLVQTAGIVAKLRADTSAFTHNIKQATRDVTGLKGAADKATSGFKGLENQLRRLTSGIDALSNSLNAVGDSLTRAGKRSAMAFAGLTAAIGGTVKMAVDFELQMTRVAQISGATGDELKMMEQAARNAGRTTVFTASQSAQALENLALAGFTAQQSVDALEGTLALAAAFQLDLAETTEMVSAQIRSFGLDASEAGRVSNVMAAAISNSMASFEKLQFSMRYTAPLFNSVGKSIEDNVAALGLLYNQGFRGEQAGTVLRAMLLKLVNPTTQAQEALARYGITLEQVNPATQDFADILRALEPLANDIGALQQIFDMEAAAGVSAILGQGADAFEDLRVRITGTNTAFSMQEATSRTLWGQLMALRSVAEEAALSFGNQFTPAIYRLTQQARDAVDRFNDLDDGTKQLIAKWTAGIAVALALGAGLAIIGAGFKGIAAALTVIKAPLKAFTEALAHPGLVTGVAIALLLWRAWDQDWGGIQTKLTGLYDTLISKWEQVKVAWDTSQIKSILTGAWDELVQVWTDGEKTLTDKVKESIPIVADVAISIGEIFIMWMEERFSDLNDWWNGYSEEFVDDDGNVRTREVKGFKFHVMGTIQEFWEAIGKGAVNLWEWWQGYTEITLNESGEPIEREVPGFKYTVLGWIESIWMYLNNGTKPPSLADWWNGYIITTMNEEGEEITREVPGFAYKITSTIEAIWNFLKDTADTVVGGISAWWNGYTREVLDEEKEIDGEGAATKLRTVTGFKYTFYSTIETIWEWVGSTYTSLLNWWNGYERIVRNEEGEIVKDVEGNPVVESVEGFHVTLRNGIVAAWNWVNDVAEALAEFIDNSPTLNAIKDGTADFLDVNGDGYFDIYDVTAGIRILWNWAVDLKKSFENWLFGGDDFETSGFARLQQTVQGVWDSAIGTVLSIGVTIHWVLGSTLPLIQALLNRSGLKRGLGGYALQLGRLFALGNVVWQLIPEDIKEKAEKLWQRFVEALKEWGENIENPFVQRVSEWLGNIRVTSNLVVDLITGVTLWRLGGLGYRHLRAAVQYLLEGVVLDLKVGARLLVSMAKEAIEWAIAGVANAIGGTAIGTALAALVKGLIVPLTIGATLVASVSGILYSLLGGEEKASLREAIQEIWDNEELSLTAKIGEITLEFLDSTLVKKLDEVGTVIAVALDDAGLGFLLNDRQKDLVAQYHKDREEAAKELASQGVAPTQTAGFRPSFNVRKLRFEWEPVEVQVGIQPIVPEELPDMVSFGSDFNNLGFHPSLMPEIDLSNNPFRTTVDALNEALAEAVEEAVVEATSTGVEEALQYTRADYADIVADAIATSYPNLKAFRDILKEIAQNFMNISEQEGVMLSLIDLLDIMGLVLSENSTDLKNPLTMLDPANIGGTEWIAEHLKRVNETIREELTELERNYIATAKIYLGYREMFGGPGMAAAMWKMPGRVLSGDYTNPVNSLGGITVVDVLERYERDIGEARELMQNWGFFAEGGHTFGGVDEIAGFVHGGEYVIPAWMKKKLGPLVDALERMRVRGYKPGGNVRSNLSFSGVGLPSLSTVEDEVSGIADQVAKEFFEVVREGLADFGEWLTTEVMSILPENVVQKWNEFVRTWNGYFEKLDDDTETLNEAGNALRLTSIDWSKAEGTDLNIADLVPTEQVSWIRRQWQDFDEWLRVNYAQTLETIRGGLQSLGQSLQSASNSYINAIGTFVSGVELVAETSKKVVYDERGNPVEIDYLKGFSIDWKQTVMNFVKPAIEEIGRSIATLLGQSRYAELGHYGSRGQRNMANFDEMVRNFRDWNTNFAEIQRLEKQKAVNTVAGGAVGAGIGAIFGPIGALIGAGIGALLGNKASGNVTQQIEDLQRKLEDTFQRISEFLGTSVGDMAGALGRAFSADTYTGFVKGFSESLEGMTKQALLQAFLASDAMQPLFEELSQSVTGAVMETISTGELSEDGRSRIRDAAQAINEYSKQFYETLRGFSLFNDREPAEDSGRGNAGTVIQNLTGPALSEFKEMLAPLGRFGEALALLGSMNSHLATIAGAEYAASAAGAGTVYHIDTVQVTMQNYQDMGSFLYDLEMSAKMTARGRGR